MVLLTRCCFGLQSLRQGGYLAGIFTLSVYLVMMVSSSLHIKSARNTSHELFLLTTAVFLSSFTCVITSCLLILGIFLNNRSFFLPWMVVVPGLTVMEVVLAFYFLPDTFEAPSLGVFFGADLLFCIINMYCFVCVLSLYQTFHIRWARVGPTENNPIPVLRLQLSSSQAEPSASYQAGAPSEVMLHVPTLRPSSARSQTDVSSVSDEVSQEK